MTYNKTTPSLFSFENFFYAFATILIATLLFMVIDTGRGKKISIDLPQFQGVLIDSAGVDLPLNPIGATNSLSWQTETDRGDAKYGLINLDRKVVRLFQVDQIPEGAEVTPFHFSQENWNQVLYVNEDSLVKLMTGKLNSKEAFNRKVEKLEDLREKHATFSAEEEEKAVMNARGDRSNSNHYREVEVRRDFKRNRTEISKKISAMKDELYGFVRVFAY